MKELVWFDGMDLDLFRKTPIEKLYTMGEIGDWNTVEGDMSSNVNPLLLYKDSDTNLSLWMTVERNSDGNYFFPIDLILHDVQNPLNFRILHTEKYPASLQSAPLALNESRFDHYLHNIFKREVLLFQNDFLLMKITELVHFLDEANQLFSPGSFPKSNHQLFDELLQKRALLLGVDGSVEVVRELSTTLNLIEEKSESNLLTRLSVSNHFSDQLSSLFLRGLSLKAIFDCHLAQKEVNARAFEEEMERVS